MAAPIAAGPATMGHYSEHLSANASAGVNHLTPNRSSLANNYGVNSPGMGSSLPKPIMAPGSEIKTPNPSKMPKGTIFT